jgi:hypothetical protein
MTKRHPPKSRRITSCENSEYLALEAANCILPRAGTLTCLTGHLGGLSAWLIAAVLLLTCPATSKAFSVLAHQAIVDQAWDKRLAPLIRKRFPSATEQDLTDARAYARGGSHLPDLGYFPLGNRLFTDLLHYVRTGDFVSGLLNEARTPQEYAFALGVMAHYEGDTVGHPLATNLAVPILHPKLETEYGDSITYAESPSAHLQTEFRFDILQVAHRGEVPELFEHSIEFKVPKEFLARVFRENYGLELDDLFENFDVALTTYRWGFRTLIDEVTGIAWGLYQNDIERLEPGMVRGQFLPSMSRTDFEHQFGKAFLEPGFFVRFVGIVGNLFPNVGPFAQLPYKPLPENVRQLYFSAFHKASQQYDQELDKVSYSQFWLPNLILDTGMTDRPGAYQPADKAYADLLRRHAKEHFGRVPAALADDMRKHFQNRNAALAFEGNQRDREETLSAVSELENRNIHSLRR